MARRRTKMHIPSRMTFQWLIGTLPDLSAEEFLDVIDVLTEKGWYGANGDKFGSNFYGMMLYSLRPSVRREVQALTR